MSLQENLFKDTFLSVFIVYCDRKKNQYIFLRIYATLNSRVIPILVSVILLFFVLPHIFVHTSDSFTLNISNCYTLTCIFIFCILRDTVQSISIEQFQAFPFQYNFHESFRSTFSVENWELPLIYFSVTNKLLFNLQNHWSSCSL